jgi:hypothetical protein
MLTGFFEAFFALPVSFLTLEGRSGLPRLVKVPPTEVMGPPQEVLVLFNLARVSLPSLVPL